MGLLRKKKKTISLEKHNVRFNFEYGCLPSAATFAPIQWFSPDNEGGDLFILDDEMKGVSWVKEYIENTSMTIYNVAGGQISMLKLPTPEASPELAYAAVTVTDQLLTTMKDETDLYYRPFCILFRQYQMILQFPSSLYQLS